jgi:pimeloyl-ACP methyl ester carboxylesterase/DNA-binding CsgD family transcriptional regulator
MITAAATSGLIETIYASTVLSRSIDAILADLEANVRGLVQPQGQVELISLTQAPAAADHPDIVRHVELARRIQTEVGFTPAGRDLVAELLDRLPSPALAFDADGEVLCRNGAAARSAWAEVRALSEWAGSATAILAAAHAIAPEDAASAVPVRLLAPGGAASCAVVKRAGTRGQEGWGRPVWLLMLADLAIDDALAGQARTVFGLTSAEAAVAVRFVQGVSLETIAAERRVSLETVRSQIKAIRAKTGARDLHALVRQMCALATGVYVGAEPQVVRATPGGEAPWTGTVRLPDGRRFDYLRQGASAGAPVVLLHTLGYGAQVPLAAHQHAIGLGVSIYAPLRAGHGHSDPAPPASTPSALLDQAADDMAAMMDQLGLPRARLVGHAAGSSQAVRFAHRYPERVEALVLLSRGPVWQNQWLSDLSPRHRALAVILRHFSSAARLVTGAMLQHFHRYGASEFAAKGALDCPPDLAALNDPEILHLLGHGVMFGLRQGPEAYCREFETQQVDLGEEARALPHPITLVYGAQDRIVPPVFAQRFAQAVPQARLIEVPDAGHYLLYSHWRAVLDALDVAD